MSGPHGSQILRETSTDFFVGLFANSDKLVDPDNRQYYVVPDERPQSHHPQQPTLPRISEERDTHQPNDQAQHHSEEEQQQRQQQLLHQYDMTTKDIKPHISDRVDSDRDQYYDRPQKQQQTQKSQRDLDDEDRIARRDMLVKLVGLRDAGIKLSRPDFSMNDSYDVLKNEYDAILNAKSRAMMIRMVFHFIGFGVAGLEAFNDKVNPLDFRFEGAWHNSVVSNSGEICSILGEIYDEQRLEGISFSPITRLALAIFGSAAAIVTAKGAAYIIGGDQGSAMASGLIGVMNDIRKTTTQINHPTQKPTATMGVDEIRREADALRRAQIEKEHLEAIAADRERMREMKEAYIMQSETSRRSRVTQPKQSSNHSTSSSKSRASKRSAITGASSKSRVSINPEFRQTITEINLTRHK